MKKFSKDVCALTIGLDLGDRQSNYCALDRDGQVVEEGCVPMKEEALRELFSRFPGSLAVFEVGAQSRWVQTLLLELDVEDAIAVDPRQIKLITQSIRKTDRKDAYILARAGQGLPELLHPVKHRSERTHADLCLLRSRDMLVKQRTQLVNRIRGMLKSSGYRLKGCDAAYFFRKAPLQIPERLQDACSPLLHLLAEIHERLLEMNRKLKTIATNRYPIVETLQTVPGVGLITALSFVLTLEHPDRFSRPRQAAAYLGLTPKMRDSGNCSPQLGITKAGDSTVRRLLVLCAHCALVRGKDSPLRAWAMNLCQRGGKAAKKRAIVALARKLAVVLLAIWKSGRPYDPELLTTGKSHIRQVA